MCDNEKSTELSPFQDKVFVRIMEGILKQTDNNRNVLLSGMGLVVKEDNPIPYYTMDCALCYLTYKEISQKIKNSDTARNLMRLETRAKRNMLIMKNVTEKKIDSFD